MGFDVIDIGWASTPTTELAVVFHQAAGGIILTASHNPAHWNALKLLNEAGEFLNQQEGNEVIRIADAESFMFAPVELLGKVLRDDTQTLKHIEKVLALPLVDTEAIRKKHFKVAVDAVNSVGGIAVPALLKALGVSEVIELNCVPTGQFAHNPEPLPEHLGDIASLVKAKGADVGFVVDPDVDRLAIVCEDGTLFGEEYTLVAVADYVLSHTPGNTVSNLSSTRALRDITAQYGGIYSAAAVGEVNVVEKMKATQAVIGGEGNGGVIYPACHYGRDALVGIALFLSHIAQRDITVSALRATYPAYYMDKQKVTLDQSVQVDELLDEIASMYPQEQVNRIDGVKIELENGWIHLRRSNTEPIIRIYAEARTLSEAQQLTSQINHQLSGRKAQ
jgi:phosphomannomutase